MATRRENIQDLRSKGASELQKLLASAREDLRDLRFRVSANQHKDIREIREVRTKIARILTMLHEAEHKPTQPGIK